MTHRSTSDAPAPETVVRGRFGAKSPGSLESWADEDLLEAARHAGAGGAEPFLDELYSRHYDQVARWCLRLTGDVDRAADLAQECFFKAHRSLDSFRGDCKFSTWMYTVVRRTAINRSQLASARLTDPIEDASLGDLTLPGDDALNSLERRETSTLIREAAAKHLNETEQQVLRLRFGTGLSLPAIDRLLGLENRSGSKTHLQSAKRKLRHRLARLSR